ncbi:MAG TPA: PfkB family carbohydrate kinase [Chloroflexota bacterium]|nr:PfkB family carbohydrate kinase [Chloroflexota bacterium]
MPDPSPPPAYVVVGHLARDVAPGGYTPGGTALYATLTARRLGLSVGVLTSVPPDADLAVLEGAQVRVVPADQATTFDNRYGPDGRVQFLYGRAAPLGPADVPAAWRAASILHLGPIANEVDPSLAAVFPQALTVATPQGWLRRWDGPAEGGGGRIWPLPHAHLLDRLPPLDVVVLSEEDVAGDAGAVDAYRTRVRIVVLTRGARGATVYAGQGVLHVPAYPAHEVDPTGAGDVFAAAFAIRYHKEKDLLGAALFAAATASLVVEAPGGSAIPSLAQVEQRLAAYELSAISGQPSASAGPEASPEGPVETEG